MTTAIPVFLDCDTGIDDALALAYLLSAPKAKLVGIGTVSGNTTAKQAANNTLALLNVVNRVEMPVAIGRHDPIGDIYAGGAPEVHGVNGIGDVQLALPDVKVSTQTAPQLLVSLAHKYPGTLRVVAIGPLTNLQLALDLEPDLPNLISELVIMGGAVWEPGNITPYAEANIYHDPMAAERVLSTEGRWQVVLVPLDVTRQHCFTDEDAAVLAATGKPLDVALATMLTTYLDFYQSVSQVRSAPLHDPLAAAIAVDTVTASQIRDTAVDVDTTRGEQRGRTTATEHGPKVSVITAVAEDAAPLILAGVLAASM